MKLCSFRSHGPSKSHVVSAICYCAQDISSIGQEVVTPKLLNRLKLHKVQVQALDFSCTSPFRLDLRTTPLIDALS